MSSEKLEEHQCAEQKEQNQNLNEQQLQQSVINLEKDYEDPNKAIKQNNKESDNEFQVIYHQDKPDQNIVSNAQQGQDNTQEDVVVKVEDQQQNLQQEQNILDSDLNKNHDKNIQKEIIEVQSNNEESHSSYPQLEKIDKSETISNNEITFNSISIQPSSCIQKSVNDLQDQQITSFQEQRTEQNNQEINDEQEKDTFGKILDGNEQILIESNQMEILVQNEQIDQKEYKNQNDQNNVETSDIVVNISNQKIENEKQSSQQMQVSSSQKQDENNTLKDYISHENQESHQIESEHIQNQNQQSIQSNVISDNQSQIQNNNENEEQIKNISNSTIIITKQPNYDSQQVIINVIDQYKSKEKNQRKFTEDTLDYNSSFTNQHLAGFVIPDDISFIKPDTDTISPQDQSVVIAEGSINQSIKQFETIIEVQTDHSSIDNSQRNSKMEVKNFQSAVFERNDKSFVLGAERMCQTEINELPNQITAQDLSDPNSFDVRRTRYRYIKCWEDYRVQIIGIFSNIVNNMSTQSIQIATSSSKNKVQQLLQFTSMKFTQIGKKGGEQFNQLNNILTELDDLNKRRMINSKRLAEFVEQSMIKEILHANSIKYESRLNRYKELSNFSIKKIQKIGRSAAEEYQDYSNIFSDLAAQELKTKNKKKLIPVFQKKDLCLHEWIFLSKVFEHYDCLKNFGIETIKFIKELKQLELQRVEGIKQSLELYVNRYEELFGKMQDNNLTRLKSDVDIRTSTKHSSFILLKSKSLKRSQDNSQVLQSQNSKEQVDPESPQKSKLNMSNPNDTKDIIEMQNFSIQDISINQNSNGSKRKSVSPDRFMSSRSPHTSQSIDPHRMIREDQNRTIRPLFAQINDIDINSELSPYQALKNYLPYEEQNYLRKIYEISDDLEVSFDHLCNFVEKFQLKEIKISQLVRKEFKAQFVKSVNVKKDVLIIITFDYNLIVVESLASNFFKKPIFFIRGRRCKFSHNNNQILVTEINNIVFRTKNNFTFIFDYQQDCQDFMETMKAK